MNRNRKFKDTLSNGFVHFCLLLLAAVFFFLAVSGLLLTSKINPDFYIAERIIYSPDNIIINIIAAIAVLGAAVFLHCKFSGRIKAVHCNIAEILMLVFIFAIGVYWVVSVKYIPQADSGMLARAAASAIAGDYSGLTQSDYFQIYPFQLGYVAILECIQRVFGTTNYTAMAISNVVFLAAAYFAVVHITKAVFQNHGVTLVTIILLGLCWQPALFCTFIYGNITGLALALLAVFFYIRYLQNDGARNIILFSLFAALAIVAKPNYWIYAIAIVICLLLQLIKKAKMRGAVSIACVLALSTAFISCVQMYYGWRADIEVDNGTPLTAHLAMGLQETGPAAGWNNGYTYNILRDNNYDIDAANQQINSDIRERIDAFIQNPRHIISFFALKTISQWNEPTFQSVWVSKAGAYADSPPPVVDAIYKGAAGSALEQYFDLYIQSIYIAFFFGIVSLMRAMKKRTAGEEPPIFRRGGAVLLLVILGGFFYHFFFEAKAQYILAYIPLLLPYAAYGLISFGSFATRKLKLPLKNETRI